MTQIQPTLAVCHCGAAERTTPGESAFDWPQGWESPTSVVPGIDTRHGHQLVCGLCPEHASELQGWGGKPFPSDDEIDWPADIRV
jgi:hypothetical protein